MLLCPLINSVSVTMAILYVSPLSKYRIAGEKEMTDIYRTSHLAHLLRVTSAVDTFWGDFCTENKYPLLLCPLLEVHPHTFFHRPPYYQCSSLALSMFLITQTNQPSCEYWTSVSIWINCATVCSYPSLSAGDWFQDPPCKPKSTDAQITYIK